MRKTMLLVTAGLGLTILTPFAGSAAPRAIAPVVPLETVRTVQYWVAGPQNADEDWERRRQWREWRRQQDEARIAEAARREAMQIKQEREQHRAWWRAKRE